MTPLVPVVSSNLAAVGYDPAERTLYVAFKSGALYAYDDVPPTVPLLLWDVYRCGGSIGSALNVYVKRAGFPYRRLPDLVLEAA